MKFYNLAENKIQQNFKAIKTGEYRAPKKGEWYLSGAIPEAWKAKNDLSSKYFILKIVKVEKLTTYRIIEER